MFPRDFYPGRIRDLGFPQLCDICSNLIMIDTKTNVVRFTHFSVQEYLESQTEFACQYTNATAAFSCLEACMNHPPSSVDNGLHLSEDLSHYAVLYWAEHCGSASKLLGLIRRLELAIIYRRNG